MLRNRLAELYHTLDEPVVHVWMMRSSKVMAIISAFTLLLCEIFDLGNAYKLEFVGFTLLFLWSYLHWKE